MPQSSKKSQTVSPQPASSGPELVDPVWIAKAVGAALVLAAVCAYAAVCALFWHGQWQIVLSPSRTLNGTPASVGLPFEEVRFAPGAGGQPELSGWWVPSTQPNDATALVLHGGAGTMSDVLRQIRLLHDNRLNVFVFDYRGFGMSSGAHPTQQQMERDTEAALSYLKNLRRLPEKNVVAFGDGLGASLAVRLCNDHHDISGLILENADGDFETRAVLDARSRLVPVSLLFNQKFALADPLHTLATPKLLISYTKSATPPVDFARAGDPKLTVEIDSPQNTAALTTTLRRFLDSYTVAAPAVLLPQKP